MEQDKFELVNKIIKDVDNILSRKAVHTFDIVPVPLNFKNKSPVLCQQNCLGLESWCIKHVYMHCYTEIFNSCILKPKKKSLLLSDKFVKLLNITLLLNPDLCTLWNKRRELVAKKNLEPCAELWFSKLVLSRKPKCNDAFSYRRWILEKLIADQENYLNLEHIVNEELRLCDSTADKACNNYHSWCHRLWLSNQLKNTNFNTTQLLMKEFQYSEQFSFKHVSDHSSFHYRQFCVKELLNAITEENWPVVRSHCSFDVDKCFNKFISTYLPEGVGIKIDDLCKCDNDSFINILFNKAPRMCDCQTSTILLCKFKLFAYELALINDLMEYFKNHETLWYHRRFILHEMLLEIYSYYGVQRTNGVLENNEFCTKCNLGDSRQKQAKIVKYDCNIVHACMLLKILCNHEKFVVNILKDRDDFVERHNKYLKFIGLKIYEI